MSENHVKVAIADMENVRTWCKEQIQGKTDNLY